MSSLTKGLILLVIILGIGAGLVFWKSKVGGHSGSFNEITKTEIELLLADVAKVNPMALKQLSQSPEMKKQQLENLKQLLAFASQAQKEGLANEQPYRQELENVRAQVVAASYDREINKDKGPMPQFGFISEDQVKAFWGEGEQPQQSWFQSFKDKIGLGKRDHDAAFERFLETKIKLLSANNPQMKDRKISDEERTQAREFYAKIHIYDQEYKDKARSGEISKEVQDRVNLQVKLQQAQFLARLYSEKLVEKAKVTDEEVDKYIAEHPELDPKEKRSKAQEILNRAKNGEDFAALANEFSEDPGNKSGEKGEQQGGLYKEVTKGQMVPAFETAALALEPGQVAPELVETDYGFHIIKLERKGPTKGEDGKEEETYDARHILISTGYKDPENPMGREMPVKMYVRQKLETEKEKKVIDDIVAANHVEVPEDFTVPEVTDEQIQEMMKNRQQPQIDMGGDGGTPPPPAKVDKKPAPKKGK